MYQIALFFFSFFLFFSFFFFFFFPFCSIFPTYDVFRRLHQCPQRNLQQPLPTLHLGSTLSFTLMWMMTPLLEGFHFFLFFIYFIFVNFIGSILMRLLCFFNICCLFTPPLFFFFSFSFCSL